jgi:hypothetical protein
MFFPRNPKRGPKFSAYFRMSVRAACEHVLSGRVRALSVAQITEKVLALGWEPHGFTPARTFVNVVLCQSHFSPKSTIVRVKTGHYRSLS